ncbi:unnamed protein product [Dicrocoelium dendriticum]|nr:unnamed protein product [Dicrocoelium dendriticum]CAH8482713.1 unnamed protein product [Dicrocoelium dendriticum]CAI2738673.1 unnamed protein product [Dicrocoelium dendriticum]
MNRRPPDQVCVLATESWGLLRSALISVAFVALVFVGLIAANRCEQQMVHRCMGTAAMPGGAVDIGERFGPTCR